MKIPLIPTGARQLRACTSNVRTSGSIRVGRLAAVLLIGSALSSATAADYYVDPATGSMSNPGTASSPWSTLQAVFAASKTFAPGDTIYLRAGYHGEPTVKGDNSAVVTIRPDGNAVPLLRSLRFTTASNWVVTGLDICPEHTAPGAFKTNTPIVDIGGAANNITIINNRIRGALSIAGWTAEDWKTRLGKNSAIQTYGLNTTITENTLENVGFGITVQQSGENAVVTYNEITNFMGDALRGLANNGAFEYNLARNCYVDDAAFNHDDFFQSWSRGPDGVGTATVTNMVVRGNVFISQTDPNQPLPARPQGIGCFDGMYENFVVENNLIILAGTSHGISLYGALNSRIVNNTVITNPVAAVYPANAQPSVRVFQHKKYNAVGWEFIAPASGNIIRNNLVTSSVGMPAGAGVVDTNLTGISPAVYGNYFTNAAELDFSLLPTAPAVDTGSQSAAPSIDILQNPRSAPYDIGAFEYINEAAPIAYEGFSYAPTLNVGTAPDSPDDYGFLGTTWTGANDILSGGLSYTGIQSIGNALQFTANVGAVRNIDMAAFATELKQVDADSVTRLGKPGTTLWVLFLMRLDAADPAATLTAGLNLNGAATGGVVKLRIGDVGTNPNWALMKSTTVGASIQPLTQGATTLLVARIKFVAGANNDEVDLFVNPPLTATPPTTPSATLRNLDIGTFDRLEIKGNRTSTIDEIAIAADWSEF